MTRAIKPLNLKGEPNEVKLLNLKGEPSEVKLKIVIVKNLVKPEAVQSSPVISSHLQERRKNSKRLSCYSK